MGEFASLLQLGFGVGAGLSVFRAPLDIRATYLAKALDDERKIIRGIRTREAQDRMGQIASIILQFNQERRKLNKIQTPFMIAISIGAVANLLALIFASVDSGRQAGILLQCIMIFISTIYYALIGLLLEIIARRRLLAVREALEKIQKGR